MTKWYNNLESLKKFVDFLSDIEETGQIKPNEDLHLLENANIYSFAFDLYRKDILGELIVDEEHLTLDDLDNNKLMVVKVNDKKETLSKIGKVLSITN